MDFKDILNHDNTFRYRLLDRMRQDCEYYLGYGGRYAKHLWAGNEKDQIEAMKALWKSFKEDEKPRFLSYEKILDYEKQMVPEKDREHTFPVEPEITDEQAAWKVGENRFLTLQTCEDGYDYTLFNENYKDLDGGQLDNPELTMLEARNEILKMHKLENQSLSSMDYDEVLEKHDAYFQASLNTLRNNVKQPTYLVIAKTEEEKHAFADSSLCMIRDWKMGWFDVPKSMHEEFSALFGVSGTEHSACRSDVTKEEIRVYNSGKIPDQTRSKINAVISAADRKAKNLSEENTFGHSHVPGNNRTDR